MINNERKQHNQIEGTKFKIGKTSKIEKYQLENQDDMHQQGFGKYAPRTKWVKWATMAK